MAKEKTLRASLTSKYLFALGVLAILSLASYSILKENIRAQKSSAAIVNVSGRQRMLSQRIALLSLRLINAEGGSEREKLRQELKGIAELMEKSHNALINGEPAMNLPGKPSSEVKAMYFSSPLFLDRQVRRYLSQARSLISDSDQELRLQNPHLQFILESAGGEFLGSLDSAVKQYQKESETKIVRLQRLQASVLLITLFILMLTGLFIFRPMVGRIQEETEKLEKRDADLVSINVQLQKEINERKNLERQLRATNEFDETLLKTFPFGIDIVDEECNLLYLNEKMQGAFSREVLGGKCYLLYKDDKKQCYNCPLKNGVQPGETRSIEVKEAMQGRAFLITHTGMFYQGKKAILEIFEDITDYRNTQEALALAERLAGMGRMAGVIAHEFRNQLGVIRNAAYFLKMKITDKDEKVRRHLKILDEQVMETERIIENILSFSRTKKPELQAVDLKDILLASLEKVIIPEGIELSTHIEDRLLLELDSLQMSSVFVNIVLNAIQAIGETGKLRIEVTKVNNYVNIIFRDTGKGIKEEDKKRIFEPFFSTKARGSGLGLVMARTIVEGHSGAINLESEYGKGTSVIIKLPMGVH